MATLADAGVNLFASQFPSLDDVFKLGMYVNSSEINRQTFESRLAEHEDNALASGVGRFLLGQMQRAMEALEKAKKGKEKFLYLALAQRRLNRFDEALKNLEQAGKMEADPLLIALEKAATLRMAGRFDEATKELAACSNFERVSAEYHYQLGRLADATGDHEKALENYDIAIELFPGHHDALFQLAYICNLRGNERAAIDYYKRIVKTPPASVNALLNMAVIHEDLGEYDQAEECVEKVLRSHPNHPKARLFAKDIESSKVMIYDEERERRQDRHNKILEIPISDFELSVRSRNCLKKMNIHTLGDLLRISEAELLSYKNFGETSLQEIKRILDSKGLRLGMALEEKSASYAAEAVQASGASEELLNKTVDDLELSVRARRCLSRLNIRTFGELITKTEAELLGCKNFGVTSLNEIKERLSGYGLSLRKLD